MAAREPQGQGSLLDEPAFRRRLAELEIRLQALAFSELATLARMSRGESPGAGSSLAKNTSVAIEQDLTTLKLEAIGYYGLPHANLISLNGANEAWVGADHAETVTARYLNARAASIFGGSQEVQKNIIAKAVLGL